MRPTAAAETVADPARSAYARSSHSRVIGPSFPLRTLRPLREVVEVHHVEDAKFSKKASSEWRHSYRVDCSAVEQVEIQDFRTRDASRAEQADPVSAPEPLDSASLICDVRWQ